MAEMIELEGLTYEQNKLYQASIREGFFDGFEENPRKWRHTFVGTLLMKYPNRASTLTMLRDIAGHIPEWKDFTDMFISDFVDEYSLNHTENSCKTIFAEIRATLAKCYTGEVPSIHYREILKKKAIPSQQIYLDEYEIELIEQYTPMSDIEEYVKKVFLIEAYTGARACDSQRLSLDNCNYRTDTLTYVSQKTKTEVRLPVHKKLIKHLRNEINLDIPLSTFNRALRRICRKVGIIDKQTLFQNGQEQTAERWQFVSSHTGRRSFATNLYLRGVDPATIAQFMGHSTPDITIKRYILARRRINDKVLEFFNQTISAAIRFKIDE